MLLSGGVLPRYGGIWSVGHSHVGHMLILVGGVNVCLQISISPCRPPPSPPPPWWSHFISPPPGTEARCECGTHASLDTSQWDAHSLEVRLAACSPPPPPSPPPPSPPPPPRCMQCCMPSHACLDLLFMRQGCCRESGRTCMSCWQSMHCCSKQVQALLMSRADSCPLLRSLVSSASHVV